MHHVQIGQIALIRDRAPGSGNRGQVGRQEARLQRLFERLAQEGREHIVLLAVGGNVPFAIAGPVLIGLGVGLYLIDKAGLINAAHGKHHRDRHHFGLGRLKGRGPGPVGNIGIARGINHPLGEDGFAPGLALGNNAANFAVLDNGRDKHAVQHGLDARLFDQDIGDIFKRFGIERMADGLRLGHGRTHSLGPLFEFAANAFAVNGLRMAIPGKALDPDLGNIAAKTTITLEQGGLDPRPGRGQRRR